MRKVPTSVAKFYVYDLVDPRDDRVFYVGSGKGKEIKKTVRLGDSMSRRKRLKLESIARSRLRPVAKIVACFEREKDAFAFERDRQRLFRLHPEIPEHVTAINQRGNRTAPPPVSSWCGHPDYKHPCRLLPYHCVPRFGTD